MRAALVVLLFIAIPVSAAGLHPDAAVREFVRVYNLAKPEPMREFLAATGSAEDRAASFVRFHGMTGPLQIRSLERPSPNEVTANVIATITEAWFRITVVTEGEKVTKIGFAFGEAPTPAESTRALSPRTVASRADAFVDRLARNDFFAGRVLIAHRGQAILRRSYNGGSLDTPTSIASVGKLFTSVAIARLEAEGKLSLDDPVGKFLPDYPNADAAQNVTVRHLLTHMAGMPDYMDAPGYPEARKAAGGALPNVTDYFPFFAAAPLQFRPGAKNEYSNSGYVVLGAIVERLTGERFRDAIVRMILIPAAIRSTPVSGVSPAGGEVSTVDDMLRFANALTDGTLLPPATLRKFFSQEQLGGTANEYGVEVERVNGHATAGHGGGAPGISTRLELYPDDGYVLVVLADRDAPAAIHVMNKVRRLIGSGRVRLPKE